MVIQVYVISSEEPLLDVWNYVKGEGVEWEVFPGILMCERVFNNLNTLYRFMTECENVAGENLRFNLQILPKSNEDDPDMMTMKIEVNKNII